MTALASDNERTPLGDVGSPAPSAREWAAGIAFACIVHALAALPFLAPAYAPVDDVVEVAPEGDEIGVRLAPLVQPPEAVEPPPPEPEIETPVIEERAADSPPPAPPEKPRETPDLPDIRPTAVPEIWFGSQGGGGGLTLDEYLLLRDWLAEARKEVLKTLSYPEEARRAGESGSAEVVIIATRNGRIRDWYFQKRTGSSILDREIRRSIGDVRRLPRFPEEAAYEELAFMLPIRFELVVSAGRTPQSGAPPSGGDSEASARRAPDALTVAQMSSCAAAAADLGAERAAIDASRLELEELRTDYERRAERYERERRAPPPSLRRRLSRYNAELEAYNGALAAFQGKAKAFQSVCGGGAATFDNYIQACQPYRETGNLYCEAFGDLWARL